MKYRNLLLLLGCTHAPFLLINFTCFKHHFRNFFGSFIFCFGPKFLPFFCACCRSLRPRRPFSWISSNKSRIFSSSSCNSSCSSFSFKNFSTLLSSASPSLRRRDFGSIQENAERIYNYLYYILLKQYRICASKFH